MAITSRFNRIIEPSVYRAAGRELEVSSSRCGGEASSATGLDRAASRLAAFFAAATRKCGVKAIAENWK